MFCLIGIIFAKIALTGRSIIQSWILQKNLTPPSAAKQGLDVGICGGCEIKMSKSACCYVNLFYVIQNINLYNNNNNPRNVRCTIVE